MNITIYLGDLRKKEVLPKKSIGVGDSFRRNLPLSLFFPFGIHVSFFSHPLTILTAKSPKIVTTDLSYDF